MSLFWLFLWENFHFWSCFCHFALVSVFRCFFWQNSMFFKCIYSSYSSESLTSKENLGISSVGIYMFQCNGNTGTMFEIGSKLKRHENSGIVLVSLHLMTKFCCLYGSLWSDFTRCSRVTIVDIDQVNAGWVSYHSRAHRIYNFEFILPYQKLWVWSVFVISIKGILTKYDCLLEKDHTLFSC